MKSNMVHRVIHNDIHSDIHHYTMLPEGAEIIHNRSQPACNTASDDQA